jgi:hypothetical protein
LQKRKLKKKNLNHHHQAREEASMQNISQPQPHRNFTPNGFTAFSWALTPELKRVYLGQ